jgi:hypothetical protein
MHCTFLLVVNMRSSLFKEGFWFLSIATRDPIWPYSQFIKSNLATALDMEGQRHCLFLYLECLAVALDHGGSRKAISGWLIIESQLRKVAQTGQEWSRNA